MLPLLSVILARAGTALLYGMVKNSDGEGFGARNPIAVRLSPFNTPQVDIVEARQKFDAEGRLNDKGIRESIQALLSVLLEAAPKTSPRIP